MKTPFTQDQFFQVFAEYNQAVFPLQLALLGFGILVVLLIHREIKNKDRWIGGFLALLWLWTGITYHLSFFTPINQAAYGFGGIFILQGIFFLIETFRGRLQFSMKNNTWQYIGYFLVWFGLLIYPLISYALSESFSHIISLGLPCPTTIFTFGWLMLTSSRFSKYLLIIPTLWALIGTGAAINFGVYQDYVMFLAAVVADIYLLTRKKKIPVTSP
jgi:hypothetical protein